MTTEIINAPWTSEQVDALNRYQQAGRMHPFTCGALHTSGQSPVLNATDSGWICPDPTCEYTQDWAHASMLRPEAAQPWQPAAPSEPASRDLRDRIAEALRRAPAKELRADWNAPNGPLQITARVNDLADAVMPVIAADTDQAAATAADVAHALDNATPYPIELSSKVCQFMASRLAEMLTIGKRLEHPVWQPEEDLPAGPVPEPEELAELRCMADEAQQAGAGDDEDDEQPCGEGMCQCSCVGVGHPCGCDCPHDDDCDCPDCDYRDAL
ncbi:hypothetical protein [Streptomyces sp. NPDC056242]|uniref:hypothetical protein n=1 Tax=Streptomyces sp. NPDC056242 TaxID=3345760 RepID=UPI0035E34D49